MEAHAMTLCFAALSLLVDQPENAEPNQTVFRDYGGMLRNAFEKRKLGFLLVQPDVDVRSSLGGLLSFSPRFNCKWCDSARGEGEQIIP